MNNKMTKIYWMSGIVWLVVGVFGGFAGVRIAEAHPAEETATIVAGQPGTEFPGAQLGYKGEGLFRTPEEAPYGTYQVVQGGSNWSCTWTRLLRASRTDITARVEAKILINNQASNVTLGPGDGGILLQGDCAWRRQ